MDHSHSGASVFSSRVTDYVFVNDAVLLAVSRGSGMAIELLHEEAMAQEFHV